MIPLLLLGLLAHAAPPSPLAICQSVDDSAKWEPLQLGYAPLPSVAGLSVGAPPPHDAVVSVAPTGTTLTWRKPGWVGAVRTWAATPDNPMGGYWPDQVDQSLQDTSGMVLVAIADALPWPHAKDLLQRLERTGRPYRVVVTPVTDPAALEATLGQQLTAMSRGGGPPTHPLLVATKGARYGGWDYQSTVSASLAQLASRCPDLQPALRTTGACVARAQALAAALPSCDSADQDAATALFALSVKRTTRAVVQVDLRKLGAEAGPTATWGEVLQAAQAAKTPATKAASATQTVVRLQEGAPIPGLGPTLFGVVVSGEVRVGQPLELFDSLGAMPIRIVSMQPDEVARAGAKTMIQFEADVDRALEAADDQGLLASPGTFTSASKLRAQLTMNGTRRKPAHSGYRPQISVHDVDITGTLTFEGELAPDGELSATVQLLTPTALRPGLEITLREGGRAVGTGIITEVIAP